MVEQAAKGRGSRSAQKKRLRRNKWQTKARPAMISATEIRADLEVGGYSDEARGL
jgi:stalled ribosome alternative rescue factor ArfA